MKVLFITSSRIGDAVLSTGLLDYITQKHPEARVTIVCGPLAVSLFEGYPNLERIIPLKKQKHHRHWLELWKQVAGTRWDMVVDLRNSAVSRLIRARRRYIYGSHIGNCWHKVEQNARVMELDHVPSPRLWPTPAQKEAALSFVPPWPESCSMSADGRGGVLKNYVIGVGPAANWRAKTWPAERFIEIIDYLTSPVGKFSYARVAVFAAPGEEDVARKVLDSVPEGLRVDVIAKCDPGTAAAVLAHCDFYIGNDSGLMHCAAAVGVPTLGLFGPSYPDLYRPWGEKADYVATLESFDELIAYEGYSAKTAPCLMEGLSVEMVKAKIDVILSEAKNLAGVE